MPWLINIDGACLLKQVQLEKSQIQCLVIIRKDNVGIDLRLSAGAGVELVAGKLCLDLEIYQDTKCRECRQVSIFNRSF